MLLNMIYFVKIACNFTGCKFLKCGCYSSFIQLGSIICEFIGHSYVVAKVFWDAFKIKHNKTFMEHNKKCSKPMKLW